MAATMPPFVRPRRKRIMNKRITLTQSALANLLNLFNPNPDDSEPIGPGGPVIHLPYFRFEPEPVPWRSARIARTAIDRGLAQFQTAELITDGNLTERMISAIGGGISSFVDYYCGNSRPPKWGGPWPKRDANQLRPIDLLVAGAQFELAAEALSDHPLQGAYSAAADQLFEAGLQQVEG
jgi:hypothetical protein